MDKREEGARTTAMSMSTKEWMSSNIIRIRGTVNLEMAKGT